MINESITITQTDSPSKVSEIAALGEKIWKEHYTPIIGEAQVAYMLKKFQSPEKILSDIRSSNFCYYGIYSTTCAYPIGYSGIKNENGRVFISKLYLLKNYRGKGIAKQMLDRILNDFPNTTEMWLTVNKYNTNSILAYQKLGFEISNEVVTDIGNGYVMDDYIMVKRSNLQV